MDRLEVMPVNADHIADWTASDPELQQVLRRVQQGWAINALKKPRAFLRGERRIKHTQWLYIVGEPCCDTSSGQKQLLEDLHTAHPGMARMKNLARSYLWWLGLDTEIEDKVKSCKLCP